MEATAVESSAGVSTSGPSAAVEATASSVETAATAVMTAATTAKAAAAATAAAMSSASGSWHTHYLLVFFRGIIICDFASHCKINVVLPFSLCYNEEKEVVFVERKPITVDTARFPEIFRPLLENNVYDSSCSDAARVYFIDRDGGYYLKTAAKDSLRREAEMTKFFHSKALAAEVLAYESLDADWLLTRRVPGEDCLHDLYLDDPIRLCDTVAQLLRMLHETPHTGCTFDSLREYLEPARRNYREKTYSVDHFPDNWGYRTPEEAWEELERNGQYLKADVLLHGDYCLPNIMLDNWRFSGFIDLDAAGVGDRHMDLFWGMWSLGFNLKTEQYRGRFLDAYGRELVNEDIFRTIAACEVFLW